MKEFIISENDAGQRLDKFLAKAAPALPKGLLCKEVRKKNIKRNGKRCEISDRLEVGDVLRLYLKDEFFEREEKTVSPALSLPPPDVLYEDTRILAVFKPVGLVVHTDDGGSGDTMIARVLDYLIGSGAYDRGAEQSFTPALCNRLDRNTSGIVLAAKTAEALRTANEMIRDHAVGKKYLCVTVTPPPKQEDQCCAYHRRREGERIVTISDRPAAEFREIRTDYRVIATREDGLSLLEVTLHTGRTHQIRAHLSHIGCPILGDEKYGDRNKNRAFHEKYQALCAYRMILPESLGGTVITVPAEKIGFLQKYFPHIQKRHLK